MVRGELTSFRFTNNISYLSCLVSVEQGAVEQH